MPIRLTVNSEVKTVDVDPETPLLWVLRDHLQLVGTKFGCGVGQCRACTVLIGGRAVRSCMTPVSEVGDEKVVTIEGLSPDGGHPLQAPGLRSTCPNAAIARRGRFFLPQRCWRILRTLRMLRSIRR